MRKTVRGFDGAVTKNSGPPTDAQLTKINSRLEKPLTQEEVFVFSSVASNRKRDSYYSIMGDSTLRNYAQDYTEGRSFMNNHRTGERATGRTFDATFDSQTGEVTVWTYTIRGLKLNDVATDDFIRGIETGIIQDVSIHFIGGRDICNVCSKRLYSKGCRHLPGLEYEDEHTGQTRVADFTIEDAHAVELSDAWKGSTPDAGVLRKAALLKRSGVLDDEMVRQFNSRFGTNLRTVLEGEEYLNFDWEDSDSSDDDVTTTADGHTASDGDGPDDPNPVTGLPKNKPVSDAHVSVDSNLDKRMEQHRHAHDHSHGTYSHGHAHTHEHEHDAKDKKVAHNHDHEGRMTKEEKDKARAAYTKLVEERGTELNPEYLADIKTYLREMDEGKEPLPPFDKANNKAKKDDDDEDDKRYLTPKDKAASVISCMRALGDKMMPGQVNPGNMDPGQMDKAGMIMPGQEPLQEVSHEAFHEVDGEAIPTEGDLVKGLTDMNSPLLTISPEGMISFFFQGKGEVLNGTGVGDGGALYVSDRSADKDGKEVTRLFQPIVSRLDDVNTVRALVSMAMDGQRLRGALYHSLVRHGCIVQGNKFDKEFHLDIARTMSTDRLEKYANDWKARAQEHLRTNPQQDMSVTEFAEGAINSRQTVVKGNRGDEPTGKPEDLFQRNELYR